MRICLLPNKGLFFFSIVFCEMDQEELDATGIVVASAFGAMMKVFLVSLIGNQILFLSFPVFTSSM